MTFHRHDYNHKTGKWFDEEPTNIIPVLFAVVLVTAFLFAFFNLLFGWVIT